MSFTSEAPGAARAAPPHSFTSRRIIATAADSRQSSEARPMLGGLFKRTRRMERTDEQLLLACRRGEEDAWEALVRRYQRLVYAVPRRAGLDEDAAAEVFQEVFTTLLENVAGIEQPSRLHAWLVTTARRKTWRIITRSKATRAFGGGEDEEDEMLSVADERALPDE